MLTLISSVMFDLSSSIYKLCKKYIKPLRFMYGSIKSLTWLLYEAYMNAKEFCEEALK